MPTFVFSIFLIGCLGGLLPDALRFARNRYDPAAVDYVRRWQFWAGLAVLVSLGGLTAWAFAAQSVIEALAYGFAAPEIISQLAGSVSVKAPVQVEREAVEYEPLNVRKWWSI